MKERISLCKFVVLNNWEFNIDNNNEELKLIALKHSGRVNQIGVNSIGKVGFHLIDEKNKLIKGGQFVVIDSPIHLVPEPFLGAQPTGIEINVKIEITPGVFLCYEGKNRQHLFQGVFQKANQIAQQKSNIAFVWNHEDLIYIICFKEKKFVFGNIYNVQDMAECIYFSLSSIQDCGVYNVGFEFYIDGDSNWVHDFSEQLLPMGLKPTPVHHAELYNGYYNSPQNHIDSYLFQLLSCELPEEY